MKYGHNSVVKTKQKKFGQVTPNLTQETANIDMGNKELSTHRRKSVAGVRNQHTSFAHSTITNSNTLDEPRCTHFQLDLLLLSPT